MLGQFTTTWIEVPFPLTPHLGSVDHSLPSQAARIVTSLTGKAHRRLQPDYQHCEIALDADWQTMLAESNKLIIEGD
jgi:hypothetical protein